MPMINSKQRKTKSCTSCSISSDIVLIGVELSSRQKKTNMDESRPVSESKSKSERQRARNVASEIFPASERQYIRASQGKRNLKQHVIFRFTVLYNGVVMSVASREHVGT